MKKFLTLITAFSLCIGLLFFSNTKKTAVKAAGTINLADKLGCTKVSVDWTSKSTTDSVKVLGTTSFGDEGILIDYSNTYELTLPITINTTVEPGTASLINLKLLILNDDLDEGVVTLKVTDIKKQTSNNYLSIKLNTSLSNANATKILAINSLVIGKFNANSGFKMTFGGHKLTKTAANPASCTTTGNYEYYTCSSCSKHFTDADGNNEIPSYLYDMFTNIPATGHSYVYVPEVVATCTSDGMQAHYECGSCGKCFNTNKEEVTKASLIVARSGHKYQKVEEVPATCQTDGVLEHFECTECHKLFVIENGSHVEKTEADLIIPKDETKHNHQLFLSQVPATYNTIGTKAVYRCTVCNELFIKDANGKCIVRTTNNMNIGKVITNMQVVLGDVMKIRFTSSLNGKLVVWYKVNGVDAEEELYGTKVNGAYVYEFDKLVPYEINQSLRVTFASVDATDVNGFNVSDYYNIDGELITDSVYVYLTRIYNDNSTSTEIKEVIAGFVNYAEAMRAYFKPEYAPIETNPFKNSISYDATADETDDGRSVGINDKINSKFAGAYVLYNNGFKLSITVKSGVTVNKVLLNGIELNKDEYTIEGNDIIVKVNPNDFDKPIKVEVDGDYYQISINNYFYRLLKYGNVSANEQALAKAAYNYGKYFKNVK